MDTDYLCVSMYGAEIPRGTLVYESEIDGSPLTFVERSIVEAFVNFGNAARHYKRGAMFGYDGKEHEIKFYEVLVTDESAAQWETATYPLYVRTFQCGTLVDGGKEHVGSALIVARAFYWGGAHPGKTSPYLKGPDISFSGEEHVVNAFQVLVYSTNPNGIIAYTEELD